MNRAFSAKVRTLLRSQRAVRVHPDQADRLGQAVRPGQARQPGSSARIIAAGLKRRNRAERRFRLCLKLGIAVTLGFLSILLGTITWKGLPVLYQTEILLDIDFADIADIADLGDLGEGRAGTPDPASLFGANYSVLLKTALRDLFPGVTKRRQRRALYGIVSANADLELRDLALAEPSVIGSRRAVWVLASDRTNGLVRKLTASGKRLATAPGFESWVGALLAQGRLARKFNWRFFTLGDSRAPELAGILGAVTGSFLSLAVCFLLAFPLGIGTAIYLEEFAPRNWLTALIEVNINNLTAVPSIVFGLLGLAVFLNFFGLPRSAPLVGGMVLALMTLPTIVIAARAALRAVSDSIRAAALGLGATPLQAVMHQVLPKAFPGIMTGTIIAMAQALGETGPLLMIGMVAFVADIPTTLVEPAVALPVQIYLWADSPERGFEERTAAAILVLLVFLGAMNLTGIWLRHHFESRG